ncbi:MAG TPA: hypothetical protein VK543_19230 [Puia sp.]|nr:hypothetical protein [Puia sp.]
MKKFFLSFFLLFTALLLKNNGVIAQGHELVKKWQTDSVLKVPESVLFDADGPVLYFSNIGGAPDGKNGKGSIGKLGLDGKIIQLDWVAGLNGPKGLGKFHNTLYAADVDELVVIDIPTSKIIKKIPVEGAQFLNDVSVDAKGLIYVSDTKTGKVHLVDNGKVSTYVEGIEGANGVLAVNGSLYVLGSGNLWKVSADKKLTKLVSGMDPSTDGIEKVKDDEFIVSCWNGIIYYVHSDGSKQTLLDTRTEKSNTADIGYDPKKRVVYVPTFFKKSVAAYELK